MNNSGENTAGKRGWQVLFALIYGSLFLFLFLVKPVPEQRIKASIGIAASKAEVASLLKGRPIRSLLLPRPEEFGWAEVTDDWAALLLTKREDMEIALAPNASEQVVLTVETRWQVHGGLLGKAVDQLIGRPARINALTTTLRTLKARAEQQHSKQV